MLQVFYVQGSPHAEGMVMAYLPQRKILMVADIYTPPAAGAPMPAKPPAAALNLYENIKAYKLDVQTIAPLHGRRCRGPSSCNSFRSRTEDGPEQNGRSATLRPVFTFQAPVFSGAAARAQRVYLHRAPYPSASARSAWCPAARHDARAQAQSHRGLRRRRALVRRRRVSEIGPRRGYLVTHPDDIRHVLQDNARNYHKSPLYDKLRVSLGNGLLTSEDAYWLRQRRMAQPAFHRQRIETLASVMAEAAKETADRWETIAARGEWIDIADEMMRLTQAIVLRTLLGADLGPFAGELDRAWTLVNEHIGESFWSLGLTRAMADPEEQAFPAGTRCARSGRVSHHQRAASSRTRNQRPAVDAAVRSGRGNRPGHDRPTAAG